MICGLLYRQGDRKPASPAWFTIDLNRTMMQSDYFLNKRKPEPVPFCGVRKIPLIKPVKNFLLRLCVHTNPAITYLKIKERIFLICLDFNFTAGR